MARIYRLYGCRIESQLPLCSSSLPVPASKKSDIRILKAPPGFFSDTFPEKTKSEVLYSSRPDGSVNIRFFNTYQCCIMPGGKTVFYEKIRGIKKSGRWEPVRPFIYFMRNNVLSFCLLKFKIESLHGSAIAMGGKVVGFIGESTYGKSTLAASFLQSGCPVVTDDLLAIRHSAGGFQAAPGVPHLKLCPDASKTFFSTRQRGIRMTPEATKFIFSLSARQSARSPLPLGVLYVLRPRPSGAAAKIQIKPLSHREAVINIIRSAHNLVVQDRGRLEYQFRFAGELAAQVSVRAVSYPKNFKRIPELRDILQQDITRQLKVFHKQQKAKFQKKKIPAG